MRLWFSIVIILVFSPLPSLGETIIVISCGDAAVQSAINSARDGDTIQLPSCSQSWSSPITINGANRSLHLRGNGESNTIITTVNWGITLGAGKLFQLSNMKMITSGSGNANIAIDANNAGANSFRIHHMTFETGGSNYLFGINGAAYGLFDHITVTGNPSEFVNVTGPGCSDWASSDPQGTGNAVFLEDSSFTYTKYSQGRPVTDAQQGGRFVIRHNTFQNLTVGGHSTFQGSTRCSALSIEIYNNTFKYTEWGTGCTWMPASINAGEVVYYNNHWNVANCEIAQIILHIERSAVSPVCATGNQYKLCSTLNQNWTNEISVGLPFCKTDLDCGGGAGSCKWKLCSNAWKLCATDSDCGAGTCDRYMDGGSGNGGSPCFNAPGTGVGGFRYPAYEWNNTWDGGGYATVCSSPPCNLNFVGGANLAKGVDYFNDTIKPGYVAYPYPHPLQTGIPAGQKLPNFPPINYIK